MAVRFMHRQENQLRPMDDDQRVVDCGTFANIIIAEVKAGQCALNGTWTDPARNNMERVLWSVGCVPEEEIQHASSALYEKGVWFDCTATIRLFAIGETRRTELRIGDKQQLTWDDVIKFCVHRLRSYRREKSSVLQWDDEGKLLRELAFRHDPNDEIRNAFGLSRK